MPIDEAAMIDRIASQQLGADPSQPQPEPQAERPKADPNPTAEEQAVSDGAPQDEAARMSDDAILYEIGGRKLTPQQIASTFDRYRDLNYNHAQNANVLKAVELMTKSGQAKDPDDVARILVAMMRGEQPNPQMGSESQETAPDPEPDDDEAWSRWEADNAATLPPGYKDMHKSMAELRNQNAQVLDMLKQVLSHSGQVASEATAGLEEAKTARAKAIQDRIINNVDSVASKLGLADEHAQDFLVFAGERGYTLDDFIDPRLTMTVMSDFKNSIDTPEMQRLREIAQRRQAFTGSLGQTPASQSAATTPSSDVDPRIARIADRALNPDAL